MRTTNEGRGGRCGAQEELRAWHEVVTKRTSDGESLISELFEVWYQPVTRCAPCGLLRTQRFLPRDTVEFALPKAATEPGGTVALTELLRRLTMPEVIEPPLTERCHHRTATCLVRC